MLPHIVLAMVRVSDQSEYFLSGERGEVVVMIPSGACRESAIRETDKSWSLRTDSVSGAKGESQARAKREPSESQGPTGWAATQDHTADYQLLAG